MSFVFDAVPTFPPEPPGEPTKTRTVKVSKDEGAYLMAKGQKLLDKAAQVSRASVTYLPEEGVVEVVGTSLSTRRGKKYLQLMLINKTGPIRVDDRDDDDDMDTMDIPQDCVGYVNGAQGAFLRAMEEEWGVILFFCEARRGRLTERLAIFGPRNGRRGVELKVMAAVETKKAGYYTRSMKEEDPEGGWSTTTVKLTDREISWALGRKGATRKKIAAASQCITEYVGSFVCFSGTEEERGYAREYLGWTMSQLDTPRIYIDCEKRTDVTTIEIPEDCVAFLTGTKRVTLMRLEEEFGVILLFLADRNRRQRNFPETLGIFGADRNRRGAEFRIMHTVEVKRPFYFTHDLTNYRDPSEGMGTDVFLVREDEVNYLRGKEDSKRRRIARASECVIEIVTSVCFFYGTKIQRRRARKYMRWLLEMRYSPVVKLRDVDEDMQTVPITADQAASLAQSGGFSFIRKVEETTDTLIIVGHMEGFPDQVYVAGWSPEKRLQATHMLEGEVSSSRGMRPSPTKSPPRRRRSPSPDEARKRMYLGS